MPKPLRLLLALLPLVVALAIAGQATAAANPSVDLKTVSPAKGQIASGSVAWKARVSGPTDVSFLVDGAPVAENASRPYTVHLDTRHLSNGTHRLTVQGQVGRRTVSSTVTVKVVNRHGKSRTGTRTKPTPTEGRHGGHGNTGGRESSHEEREVRPTPTESPQPTPTESHPVTPPSEPGTPTFPLEETPAPAEESPVKPIEESPSTQPIAAPDSIYWGAWIGNQLTGEQPPWDMSAVTKFEQMAGKPVSLISFAAPFANCPTGSSKCTYYNFPVNQMNAIRSHGAIPFYSWSSQSIPSTRSEPNFQLSDVIAGTYDAYIRQFAEAAKAWGHPFFLRFNWEMNGNWFPWSEGANGNKPGEYVAAWRHVHDIFSQVGASNVSWVWCPNVDPEHNLQSLESLYPGDAYVDWTSLDGYNWGTNPAKPDRWRTFDQLYHSTYETIVNRIAPSKPMAIGEVGSTEDGGSKAVWIEEMLREIPTHYQKIRALIWFEQYDDGMDWPIETSPSSISAFARGLSNAAYAGNSFGALPFGRIAPSDS